jgi:hypothetical protein
MAKYPGLGLPLRHKLDLEADDLSYPTNTVFPRSALLIQRSQATVVSLHCG